MSENKQTQSSRERKNKVPTHLNITINIPIRNNEELTRVFSNFKRNALKARKKEHGDIHNSTPDLCNIGDQLCRLNNCQKDAVYKRYQSNHSTQHSPVHNMKKVESFTSFVSNLTNHNANYEKPLSTFESGQTSSTSKCNLTDEKLNFNQKFRKHKAKSQKQNRCMENKIKPELNTSFVSSFDQLQLNNKKFDLSQNIILNEEISNPTENYEHTEKHMDSYEVKTSSTQIIKRNQVDLNVKYNKNGTTVKENNSGTQLASKNESAKDSNIFHEFCGENRNFSAKEDNFCYGTSKKTKITESLQEANDMCENNISKVAVEINQENKSISEKTNDQGHHCSKIMQDTVERALITNKKQLKTVGKSKKRAATLPSKNECQLSDINKRKCKYVLINCKDKDSLEMIDKATIPHDINKDEVILCKDECKRKDKTPDIICIPIAKNNLKTTKADSEEREKIENDKDDAKSTFQQDGILSGKSETSEHYTKTHGITGIKKRNSAEENILPCKKQKKNDNQISSNDSSSAIMHKPEQPITEKGNTKIPMENQQNEIESTDNSKLQISQSTKKNKIKTKITSKTSNTVKARTKIQKTLNTYNDSSEDEEKDFGSIMEYLKEYVDNENNFNSNRNKLKSVSKNRASEITLSMKLKKLDSSESSSSDSSFSVYTAELSKNYQGNKQLHQNKVVKQSAEYQNVSKVNVSDATFQSDMIDTRNDVYSSNTTGLLAENTQTLESKGFSNGKNKNNTTSFLKNATSRQPLCKKKNNSVPPRPSQQTNTKNAIKYFESSQLKEQKDTRENSTIIKSDPEDYIEVGETEIYSPELNENGEENEGILQGLNENENKQMTLVAGKISKNKQQPQKKSNKQYTHLKKNRSSLNELSDVKVLCNNNNGNLKKISKKHKLHDPKGGNIEAKPESRKLILDYFDRVLTKRFENKSDSRNKSSEYISDCNDSSTTIKRGVSDFETEKEDRDSDTKEGKTKMLEIISYANDSMINILEENEQLRDLDINISWDVPISHTIETRISSCPTKSQQKLFKDLNIKSKTGPFTGIEDQIIKNNFEDFCKKHGLHYDPVPFLNFQYGTVSILNTKQRIDFGRYLGKGLENRKLYCIYSRFKTLYSTYTKGRFTPEEDAVVLEYMKLIGNGKNQFSMLSKLLNRPRPLIEKRYRLLQRKSELLHPKDYQLFVKLLMKVTKSRNLGDLKRKDITDAHWTKISKKLNIHQQHLKVCWKSSLYTKLFHDGPICVDVIMRKLIRMLDKNEEDDYRNLNWTKLVEPFENITRSFLYRIFKKTIASKVPPHLHANLRKCILYLKNLYQDNNSVMSNINKIEISLEDNTEM